MEPALDVPRRQRGHVAYQGMRFLVVSLLALVANLVILHVLVALGLGKVPRRRSRSSLVTPLNFVGNKLWSFRLRADDGAAGPARSRPPVAALGPRAAPGADGARACLRREGSLIQTPFAPPRPEPHGSTRSGERDLPRDPKVARLARALPAQDRATDADFDADDGTWTVHVWSGDGRRDRDRAGSTTRPAS